MANFHLTFVDGDTKKEVFHEAVGDCFWNAIKHIDDNLERFEEEYNKHSNESFEGLTIKLRDIGVSEDI